MKPENEKLDQLTNQLYDAKTSEDVLSDIHAGDAIFDSFAVKGPDENALREIENKMDRALHRKKSRRYRWYLLASTAAVIVLAFGLFRLNAPSSLITNPDTTGGRLTREVSSDFWTIDSYAEDTQVAWLYSEIEDIEQSLQKLSRGESIVVQTTFSDYEYEEENHGLTDLEMEIVDTSESFWKG